MACEITWNIAATREHDTVLMGITPSSVSLESQKSQQGKLMFYYKTLPKYLYLESHTKYIWSNVSKQISSVLIVSYLKERLEEDIRRIFWNSSLKEEISFPLKWGFEHWKKLCLLTVSVELLLYYVHNIWKPYLLKQILCNISSFECKYCY